MVLILNDADVKALNPSMSEAVQIIEKCFRVQASGDLTNHPRVHLPYPPSGVSERRVGFGDRFLRILPAIVPAFGAASFRAFTVGPQDMSGMNATTDFLVLFGFEDMTLKAIIHDMWVHYIRTGAPAGVVANYLARSGIETVGVVGTGRIARRALEAVASVRKFRRVKVYSPNVAHRQEYVEAMTRLLEVEVEARDHPQAVVAGADILITATNAYRPVLDGDWLEPGALVISMAPGELDVRTIERGRLFAAWKQQALHDTPKREPFKSLEAQGRFDEFEAKCREFHDVLTNQAPGRLNDGEIIVCLVPASSIWDAAIAQWIYDLARAKGIGKEIVF
jgi:alanine dehydrogenase